MHHTTTKQEGEMCFIHTDKRRSRISPFPLDSKISTFYQGIAHVNRNMHGNVQSISPDITIGFL